jgi:serine/threonine protein kinase
MSDLEGIMLSDYLLLQCIGKGGVADVYRARQSGEENYEVAVKVYRPGYAQHDSFREYFMAEAEKIGQFDHPNILPFLEFGEGEGLLYAVTPFVAAGTLEDLLRRVGGKFSAMQALPIVQQVCSAVQYAHDHDVIHGNIKPGNIFVAADGRMLLADFGIARGYDDSQQSLTRVGWGSAEYYRASLAEQSLGVLRRSSDIYALGVLLFRILTGQPPFTGQTPVEVLLKHVRQQSPSARLIVPSISDAVDGVILRAMQKHSDDRFSSAEELGNAFVAAVTVAPVASPVAKAVDSSLVPQTIFQSAGSMDDPQTPEPFLSASTIAVAPETPVPAHLAYSTYSSSSQTLKETAQPTTIAMNEDDTDRTEVHKKNMIEEQIGAGKTRFWTVDPDPVEWSPVTNAGVNSIPLTADDYLRNKAVVTMPEAVPPPSSFPAEQKKKTHDEESTAGPLAVFLHKLLPAVVVILLLLGLLGALLSSFYLY